MWKDGWERYRKGFLIAGVLVAVALSFWGYYAGGDETEMPLTPPAYLSGGELTKEPGNPDQKGAVGKSLPAEGHKAESRSDKPLTGEDADADTNALADTPKPAEESPTMYVDLKGQVKTPGVYAFQENDRIQSVVTQAGGFLPDADAKQINLAQPLEDGMVIYVPSVKETASSDSKPLPFSPAATPSTPSPSPSQSDKVNLNTASADQLMTLPGIGQSKADAILTYRNEHGGFRSVDELKNISGIGDKTYIKLAPKITVE